MSEADDIHEIEGDPEAFAEAFEAMGLGTRDVALQTWDRINALAEQMPRGSGGWSR